MRYLFLLCLCSCISDVLPEGTAVCDEWADTVTLKAEQCGFTISIDLHAACQKKDFITNASALRDCIARVQTETCAEAKQETCHPKGFGL